MNRNQNWYDANAARSYPLDDRATRTGDGGERLPNDVLVDLNLRFPSHLGEYAYLSSLAVTGTLVSATFLACPDPDAAPDTFVPLAAVTARRAQAAGRHVALTALYPGVGGWAVFGDVGEPFSGRFSTPRQGLLLPRCARPYRKLPVESVRKLGVATALTGVVALRGSGDVEVTSGERVVEGVNRRVVVVRLNSFSGARNVFDLYKGPCGARPESENCSKAAVEFINTVGPDCAGNIELVFVGDTQVTPYAGSSEGLVLDHPIGLTEACTRDDRLPDRQGRLPNEYDDLCTSEFEGPLPDDYTDTDTQGESDTVQNVPTVSSEVTPCPPLPFLETFDDQDAEDWRVLAGAFDFASGESPAEPHPDYPTGPVSYGSSQSSSLPVPLPYSYWARSHARRNVSIWDSCALDDTLGVRVRTELKVLAGGPKTNGGLVLNYHTVGTPGLRDEYLVAEIDLPTDSLRLRFWNGTSFLTLAAASGLGLVAGDWYRIEADVVAGPVPATQTQITVRLQGITDAGISASFTAVTERYLPADGRMGLGSDQSDAVFSFFYAEEI